MDMNLFYIIIIILYNGNSIHHVCNIGLIPKHDCTRLKYMEHNVLHMLETRITWSYSMSNVHDIF